MQVVIQLATAIAIQIAITVMVAAIHARCGTQRATGSVA